MSEGWAAYTGGRHHGAHGDAASRELGVEAGSFLDFSANINPAGPPPGALEAARQAISTEAPRYPDPEYPELREALAGYLGVPEGHVLPTNGGADALFLAAGAATGGKALVLEPTFSEYAAAAEAAGMEVVRRVAWRPGEGEFSFDRSVLGDLEGIGLVFLCNPNNPTGTALSREEVLGIAARVEEAGAVLVVDEAFADFVPEVGVPDAAGPGLVVARSFTKFFAVPGLRLGCLVSPETERFRARQPSWSVNVAAAAAGVAAVGDVEYVERSLERTARLRRELFRELPSLPGVTPFTGAANFLLLRVPPGTPERLARRGMLVRGCGPFAGLGPEYIRVAVRESGENRLLVEALREAS
ncbi:MAG: threonine-phosphate decarboxylase [Rubrobacter sp.]|nr:threonine-phosphate decarboxylase [Rubrobacter sp.]